MKKLIKGLLPALAAAFLVFTLTSCGELLQTLVEIFQTDVNGSVVNAMADETEAEYWKDGTDDSLEGAVISLYLKGSDGLYATTATDTATVTSNGNYYFYEIPMGEYKIDGVSTGWTFVPRYVDISGDNMTMPPVIAYPDQADDTVVIVLSWEDEDLDLDACLTYYDGSGRDYIGYFDNGTVVSNELDLINMTAGGFQDGNSSSATCPITRPRDIQSSTVPDIPRVETILIPWGDSAAYLDATGTTNEVADNELRLYVNCYTSTLSLTGLDVSNNGVPFSGAQVDIMYTDYNGNTDHYGGTKVPWNTDTMIMQMASIFVDSVDGFVISVEADNIYDYNSDNNEVRSAQ